MVERHQTFLAQGNAALPRLRAIDARLAALQAALDTDFPLSESQVVDLCTQLANRILEVRDIEQSAIDMLKVAIQ
jgi:hypothetical protein